MNPNQTEPKLAAPIIIKGAVSHTVKFIDDSRAPETVAVRLTPLDAIEDYYNLITHIYKFVAFLTLKDEEWARSLDEDSLYEIDELGKQVNGFRYARLLKRQQETLAAVKPMLAEASALTSS